jgi:hypothetical protein
MGRRSGRAHASPLAAQARSSLAAPARHGRGRGRSRGRRLVAHGWEQRVALLKQPSQLRHRCDGVRGHGLAGRLLPAAGRVAAVDVEEYGQRARAVAADDVVLGARQRRRRGRGRGGAGRRGARWRLVWCGLTGAGRARCRR